MIKCLYSAKHCSRLAAEVVLRGLWLWFSGDNTTVPDQRRWRKQEEREGKPQTFHIQLQLFEMSSFGVLRLKAKGEESGRGWDGWIASPVQWNELGEPQEIVRDREAWSAIVHVVAKSWRRLSYWTTTTI